MYQGCEYGDDWDDLTSVTLVASTEYSSSMAVDNLKSEDGYPWHSQKGDQWVTFQFASNVLLAGFRTKAPNGWDGGHFNEFSFDYSTDGGSNWVTFYEGHGSNLDCCDWETVIFGTAYISALTYRLSMKNNHGYNTFIVIQQLELLHCKSSNSIVLLTFRILTSGE